jgi:hypothetical protein
MRCLFILAVLPLTALVAAQQPAPTPADIGALIKQLGSDDYTEREAASKRLNAIGTPALAELREALRSENPEVVRRAHELVRKIEYRIDNEKTLAPSLVTLDAKNERLDDVLAAISKQAECEVVLNGPQLQDLANRRITVSTGGEVPFWDAVLRLCDAAGVEVAGAGGFTAPNALPLGKPQAGVRAAKDANRAVVLEDRGTTPRRPSAIYGAVLVEVLPFPQNAGPAHSALLQVWPEPRLLWGSASGVKIGSAIDAAGERIAAESISLAPPTIRPSSREGLVMVRKRGGGVAFKEGSAGLDLPLGFKPNTRQAVVRFKPGETPSTAVKELNLAVLGTVRSGIEPLSRTAGLEADQQATGTGVDGVEFTVSYYKNLDGRLGANVTLAYDRGAVEPVGVGDELPGTKGGGPGKANHSVQGVRITDVDGKPYTLGMIGGSSRPDGGRQVMTLSLELHPDKNGHGPPVTATFWGSYARPVEVPVVLRNVPLSGGK